MKSCRTQQQIAGWLEPEGRAAIACVPGLLVRWVVLDFVGVVVKSQGLVAAPSISNQLALDDPCLRPSYTFLTFPILLVCSGWQTRAYGSAGSSERINWWMSPILTLMECLMKAQRAPHTKLSCTLGPLGGTEKLWARQRRVERPNSNHHHFG